MARYKQPLRIPSAILRRPRQPLAMMRASGWRRDQGKSTPEPSQKKPKKAEVVDLSTEIHALELDVANNPHPDSSRPRQQPAMSRYRGASPRARAQVPREKRRQRRSQKSRNGPAKPEAPAPLTSSEDPARRRSELTPPQDAA